MGKNLTDTTAINLATRTYSHEELNSVYKALILKKLEKAKHDATFLADVSTNQNSTTSTGRSFDFLEDSGDLTARELNKRAAERQKRYIKNLEDAIVRIEDGTYGICRCGKCCGYIDKKRMLSVPHTTICVEGKISENTERRLSYLQRNSVVTRNRILDL